MGMQTQLYFTDKESLKAHEAWANVLKILTRVDPTLSQSLSKM